MRQIEKQMNRAIKAGRNFKLSNTEVISRFIEASGQRVSYVYLHDHAIAIVNPGYVTLSSCGWHTPTTKSRLNAVLNSLNCHGHIVQRKGLWYIDRAGVLEEFEDGVTINY